MAKKRPRKPFRKKWSKRILIVCEGKQTEPNYFYGLKEESGVKKKYSVVLKPGRGETPDRIVETAIQLQDEEKEKGKEFVYDEVWCVMDVECDPSRRGSLERAIRLAEQNGISICFSNPSFEVWVLAHFEKSSRAFHNVDELIQCLNRKWLSTFNADYQKNDVKVYEKISGFTNDALKNAHEVYDQQIESHGGDRLACNSSTEVYQLVEELLG